MKFKNDIEKFEFFESVLNNNISDSQKKEFEEALKQNESLANEFNDYQNLHELVIDDSVLEIKETFSSIHQEVLNNLSKGKGFSGNNLIFSIVFGIVVVSTVIFFLLKEKETEERVSTNIPDKKEQKIEPTAKTKEQNEKEKPLRKENKKEVSKSVAIEVVKNETKEDNDDKLLETELESEIKEEVKPDKNGLTEALENNNNKIQTPKPDKGLVDKVLAEENSMPEPEKEEFNCNQVNINLKYNAENSCVEEINTGKIQISKNSIAGGTAPYLVSINGGKDYYESKFLFNYLRPGSYQLFVKDKNLCEEEIDNIVIKEVICEKDYKYSPILGDPWIIPVEKGKKGVFRLLSKTGQILVERRVDEYSDNTWFGKDDNGNPLKMDYYLFIIQYSDGVLFNGSVTLLK